MWRALAEPRMRARPQWNSWMDFLDGCDEQARQLRAMDSVVKRFLNKGITMALNQWCALAHCPP